MREVFEFRIPERWAIEWLNSDDGVVTGTGTVRVVRAARGSELYERVLRLEKIRRRSDDRLFLSWSVEREYETSEINEADLLHVRIENVFEPPGEEFGAIYLPNADGPAEADNRVGPLILPCGRFRGECLAESIAGERVAGPALIDIVARERFGGIRFGPVVCSSSRAQTRWAELIVTSPKVSLSPRTVVGNTPLDYEAPHRWHPPSVASPIGLRLLSELWIRRDSWDRSDFTVTRETVGAHQGYLRPSRPLLISQRVYAALSPRQKRGLRFEIVHITD